MKQSILSIILSVLIILSTPILFSSDSQALTQSWTKDFVTESGKSKYTLTLNSPDEVSRNSNWTITTVLDINNLDKFKTFVFFSSIIMTVETENGEQMKDSIHFGNYPIGEFPDRIYPGGRWGPENITFNLNEADIEIPIQGSVDATIYIMVNVAEFLVQPFRAEQLPVTTYETFALSTGPVKIVGNGNVYSNYLPLIFGFLAAVVIFSGLIVWDRFSKRKSS
jgi:hypothetical protein